MMTTRTMLGLRVAFTTAAALITTLGKELDENRLDERLELLTQPRLLIIDGIGYLPIDRQGASLFFQLVSRRYERGSILLTSNQSLGAWGEVFGDAVIASAILDHPIAGREYQTIIDTHMDELALTSSPSSRIIGLPRERSADPPACRASVSRVQEASCRTLSHGLVAEGRSCSRSSSQPWSAPRSAPRSTSPRASR
jgi:hypothetical protein